MKTKKVLDLFSGAGGFSTGFERIQQFNIIAGVDSSKNAVETWSENHTGTGICHDLTEITPETLEESFSQAEVNIIIGGPPCQDFTKCNRMIDLGRNNLVLLYGEYVSHFNPDVFVIENVRQLQTQNKDLLHSLEEKLPDYEIAYRTLDAADYGVPQHRLRTFVIGVKNGKMETAKVKFPAPTYGPDSKTEKELVTAKQALKNVKPPENKEEYINNSKYIHLLDDIPPGLNYSFYTEKLGHPNPQFEWRSRFSDFLYKADPEKPVRTLKAKPGASSGPFHWENRRFTEKELKALQSFPKTFNFPHGYTTVVKQIGNSVAPKQAEAIAYAVKAILHGKSSVDINLINEETDLNFISRRRTSSEEYRQKASNALN